MAVPTLFWVTRDAGASFARLFSTRLAQQPEIPHAHAQQTSVIHRVQDRPVATGQWRIQDFIHWRLAMLNRPDTGD